MKFSSFENRAEEAEKYQPFAVNLREIKRTVSEILSLFGRNGVFSEYTKHDISHVDDLLEAVEWLIPSETHDEMSPADRLLIVLSAYFHDLGLVVTEEEFRNRDKSNFQKFVEDELFSGSSGADYRQGIAVLDRDERDRFLYQEFVRANHGRRVRQWIEGRHESELGFASAQVKEIGRLLEPLDESFRRDLALVCESHNLDDISNINKYKVSKPYGNSDEETANVQYACVILRTADLIQITRNRAPSTLYKLINPTNPISQIEWLKQNSVKRVRSKEGVDREGNASRDASRNTIEIYASFSDGAAFFGLNSYLSYAEMQIQESYSIILSSKRLIGRNYAFPWRYIDDSNIEVDGFVKRPFGFEIDQHKILDLLTGHTLYNDTNVVVRELIQNSLDAIRLQGVVSGDDHKFTGKLRVVWDSESSTLSVIDNGTGMTQHVIENHLLKVGSSQYQDSKFKESYPEFSPISRFGIGVLSSFMVADAVDVVTVTSDEDQARHISLRSVHGKYLIRLLDKKDPQVGVIGAHGTHFKLTFRHSANRTDILHAVRSWVLFPRCEVEVIVDGEAPVSIGYVDPKSAVSAFVHSPTMTRWGGQAHYDVRQSKGSGYTLAYALRYSAHYRDWNLVGLPESRWGGDTTAREEAPFGACIEGIAVEAQLPGFNKHHLLAVCEARGKSSPRTNVARSMIEETAEKRELARATYSELFAFATEEMTRLQTEEDYSLTWAVDQMPFILGPLLEQGSSSVKYRDIHREELSNVPILLIEDNGVRKAVSLAELQATGPFWTVDSRLHRSIEQFIKEAKAEITTDQLLRASQGTAPSMPEGPILANISSSNVVSQNVTSVFEVSELIGNVRERRLDMHWKSIGNRWLSRESVLKQLYNSGRQEIYTALRSIQEYLQHDRFTSMNTHCAISDVSVSGLDEYFAVKSNGDIFLLPDTPICDVFGGGDAATSSASDFLMTTYIDLMAVGTVAAGVIGGSQYSASRFYKAMEGVIPPEWMGGQERVLGAVEAMAGRLRVFDPMAWTQREFRDTHSNVWF